MSGVQNDSESDDSVNVEYRHRCVDYRAGSSLSSVLLFNGHGHGGRDQAGAASAAAGDVGARRSRRGGGRLRLLQFLFVNLSLFGASVLKPDFHLKHKTRI